MELVIEDFLKVNSGKVGGPIVLDIQKVPLQGSYSVPTGSALGLYCNVKLKKALRTIPITLL
jgi:hypothetical protein